MRAHTTDNTTIEKIVSNFSFTYKKDRKTVLSLKLIHFDVRTIFHLFFHFSFAKIAICQHWLIVKSLLYHSPAVIIQLLLIIQWRIRKIGKRCVQHFPINVNLTFKNCVFVSWWWSRTAMTTKLKPTLHFLRSQLDPMPTTTI